MLEEQLIVITDPVKRGGAEHGVERVDERQRRAVSTDEARADPSVPLVQSMWPMRLERFGCRLTQHRVGPIDGNDRPGAERPDQLRRQPAGPAADVEYALAWLRREPTEHAPSPLELRVRYAVISLSVPVRHNADIRGSLGSGRES